MFQLIRPSIASILLVTVFLPSLSNAQVPKNLPGIELDNLDNNQPQNQPEEVEEDAPTRSPRFNRWIIRLSVIALLTVFGFAGKLIFGALSESSEPDDPGGYNEVKIKTRCTKCKKGYRVSVDKVGNTIKCSNCNEYFTIRDISN